MSKTGRSVLWSTGKVSFVLEKPHTNRDVFRKKNGWIAQYSKTINPSEATNYDYGSDKLHF